MIRLLTCAFLMNCSMLSAQNGNIEGTISHGMYAVGTPDLRVEILRMADSVVVAKVFTDTVGHFEWTGIPKGRYQLLVLDSGDRLVQLKKIVIKNGSTTQVDLIYPCRNGIKPTEKKCLYGHKDNILRIQYGFPSEEQVEDARNGKVVLGGCIVNDCDPMWYCKMHHIRF